MEATFRQDRVQRGVRLEQFTIAYNCVEAFASLVLGFMGGSIALVGFGFDSVIEVTSGATLLWRLKRDSDHAERIALRIVGWCFVVLAAYVAWEAIESLLKSEAPERTPLGVVIALASVIVMPILAKAKRQIASEIGSAALRADSKQTSLCTYLSIILLAGVGLNELFGWWWADPVAALVMVPIIAREGYEALQGKKCSDCSCQ